MKVRGNPLDGSGQRMSDFLKIVREICALIENREVKRAIDLTESVRREYHEICVKARVDQITQINTAIHEAKQACEAVRKSIESIPSEERFLAEIQIEKVLRKYFEPELGELRERKRQLSLPP